MSSLFLFVCRRYLRKIKYYFSHISLTSTVLFTYEYIRFYTISVKNGDVTISDVLFTVGVVDIGGFSRSYAAAGIKHW
jgi:hypothetical protein